MSDPSVLGPVVAPVDLDPQAKEHRRRLSFISGTIAQEFLEHDTIRDGDGNIIVPVPDPHPQYFHLVNDTAWAGMGLGSITTPLLVPGATIAPFDNNIFTDYQLVSNLTNGTIVIDVLEGGGYQINIYGTFQAVSNGGGFGFSLFANGSPTGLSTIANLSNQSDIGNFVIVGFFSIDSTGGDITLTIEFDVASTKNITILGTTWTMNRLFPPLSELGVIGAVPQLDDFDNSGLPFTATAVVPLKRETFVRVVNDTPVVINTHADSAVAPTNWLTYQTIDIDPAMPIGVYEVVITLQWSLNVANRSGLFRTVVNGVTGQDFMLEVADVSNVDNMVMTEAFISDGVTPHQILLQGLVEITAGLQELTILGTRVRVFIEDSIP